MSGVLNDELPPQEFSITLEQTDNAFSGRYFITFNTTDKQSGIDHYEVIEEPLSESGLFNWGRVDAPWITVKSPYQLKDQTLNSTIRVRAVDKAGNEYVATLVPDEAQRTMGTEVKVLIAVIAAILVAFVFAAVFYVFLRSRRRKIVATLEETDEDDEMEES